MQELVAIENYGMGIYSLYLNRKQASVNDKMDVLIKIMKEIRDELRVMG